MYVYVEIYDDILNIFKALILTDKQDKIVMDWDN